MNEHVKPYQDVHVRRAISYALDRASIVHALLFGNGQAANTYLPPSIPYYDGKLPAVQFDLAKAKQEMAASSVPNGFTTTFLTDNLAVDMEEAQIVQQQLKPLGIKVKIRTVDADQEWTVQGKDDFDITLEYWSMDIPDPDESTEFFCSPAGGGNCYFSYYNSPTMTKLVAQSASAFDPGQARRDLRPDPDPVHAGPAADPDVLLALGLRRVEQGARLLRVLPGRTEPDGRLAVKVAAGQGRGATRGEHWRATVRFVPG